MAATILKSRWLSASARSEPQRAVATADSPSLTRLRVVIAPEERDALAAAISRGAAISVVAQVVEGSTTEEHGLADGERLVIEAVGAEDLDHSVEGSPGSPSLFALEPLTKREREVLELVAEGMSNRAIAERLGNSEHTVKFHVGSLLGKLNAATRAELVAIAARRGLIMV